MLSRAEIERRMSVNSNPYGKTQYPETAKEDDIPEGVPLKGVKKESTVDKS